MAKKKTTKKTTKKKAASKKATKAAAPAEASKPAAKPKKAPAKKAKPAAASALRQPVALTYDQIAARAFQVWERKGRPDGQDAANWKEAEAELLAEAQRRA